MDALRRTVVPVAERLRMWVDPTLPMPESFNLRAYTQANAIAWLRGGGTVDGTMPEMVSMGTGSMEVALHLLEGAILGTIPRMGWTYHGMVPRERDDILRIMGLAEKYWSKIK
jgi:hypothetical protein